MEWVYIDSLGGHVGKQVTVKGWVYNTRSSGRIKFLVVRDGTGLVQCVISKADSEEASDTFDKLTQESSVIVTGTVGEDSRAPGGYEILASGLELVHAAESYPITPKEHGVAFLMDHRHLWLRSSRQNAILRIRAEVIRAAREYLDGQGFTQVDAPIITAARTSQGSLRVVPGPSQIRVCPARRFRPGNRAHGGLDMVFDLSEGLITYVVARVLEKRKRELSTLERDIARLESVVSPFPRITYDEALKLLGEKGHEVAWGDDLGAAEETVLSEAFDRPVFIHHYPAGAKAFYMQPDPENEKLVMCTDMLAPEGIGGSTDFPGKPSSGTWTFANTGLSRTPVSAWESSARWPGYAESGT
jgi:asparaginyl-tRNA synthetase